MIRFIVGLLLVLGGIGGIEHSTPDSSLVGSLLTCVAGLALMAWAQATSRAFRVKV